MPVLTPAGYGATFSKKAFHQWEKVIFEALQNYPNAVYVKCEGRRPDTLCSRIREAARGFWTHNYSSYIDRHDFFEKWPNIVVIPGSEDRVVLGHRDHLNSPTDLANPFTATKTTIDIVFDCTTLEQLKAFLTLANESCFRQTPIKLLGLTPPCTNFLLNGTYQLTYPNTFVDVLSANEAILL
jgi:hypothetical protein